MSAQKIFLIRHGQTDYNVQGIVQGSGVNSPLNETGRRQADLFYSHYHHEKFDRVYTSRLIRSQESVTRFIGSGLPHDALIGLNEISWGNREGQKVTPEEDAYYHWVLRQWQEGNTGLPIEGGESPEQVAERQSEFLGLLRERKHEKQILVCMHGRAMRILLCRLLNYPLRSMDMFEHTNLGLYVISGLPGQFKVERYNDTRHLSSVTVPTQVVGH